MIIAAFISFISFWLILSHIKSSAMRKLVGYKGWVDLALHGTIIFLFFGTSTEGLMQAEAAGILFSIYLRGYARVVGYSRLVDGEWVFFPGALTK